MIHPHERLIQLGSEGHKRIQSSSVIIIGAGGLAHAILPYLAAAGVHTMVIVDGDVVEESNLHRQILFTKNDIGTMKVAATHRYLSAQFPDTMVQVIPEFLGHTLDVEQLPVCQLILDCSDNFSASLSAEEYAQRHEIPLVYGKASRWGGQVTIINGQKAQKLTSVFRGMQKDEPATACSAVGVMGPALGAVGGVMASEALKLLGGMSSELDGKLWTFDFLICMSMTIDLIRKEKRTDDPYITMGNSDGLTNEPFVLIDVREEAERKDSVAEALQIPFSVLTENLAMLPAKSKLVFFCESGERARQALTIARFHGRRNVTAVNLSEIANGKWSTSVTANEKM